MPNTLPACNHLVLDRGFAHLEITFNRPESRNAMNDAMAGELEAVFAAIATDTSVRAVVLRGAGRHFCAGGDLKEMTDALASPGGDEGDGDRLFQLNRRFGELLRRVDAAPQAVVAVVHGAARGAGFGLACVADIVLVRADCSFAMPETGLGLPPAQILPFVVRRLGPYAARRLALTGRPMSGAEAAEAGLAMAAFADDTELERALQETLVAIAGRGPTAIAQTKRLIADLGRRPLPLMLDEGARLVAESSRNGEGREGLAAFFAKRPPTWAPRDD